MAAQPISQEMPPAAGAAPLVIRTNPAVVCDSCQELPVAVINGHQRDQCPQCYARNVRLLAELYSDWTVYRYADRLDLAVENWIDAGLP